MKYVLVHGGWWNGWGWHQVAALLEQAGHHALVIEQLPSCGTEAALLGDVAADVAHVRRVVDAVGGDVVLVGHSYGGIVLTELADHPAVRHDVFVSGLWPRAGQTLLDIRSPHTVEWVTSPADGALAVVDDEATVRAILAADLGDAAFADFYGRRMLMGASTFVTPATAPARRHPASYVVCDRDEALAPAYQQKMAARADRVLHLDASHFALLSRPAELTDILLSV